MRNSTLLSLILTSSLTFGCEKIDPSDGETPADSVDDPDTTDPTDDTDDEITFDDLPAELQALISNDLLAQMESLGPDELIDVRSELERLVPDHGGEDPSHLEMVNHPEDGTRFVINGEAGDLGDFEAHMDLHYDNVQAYIDELHDLRTDTIIAFLEHNVWDESHDAHGPAMDSLHHDVRHAITNRDIPAFMLHNIDHIFGLHLDGESKTHSFDASIWADSLNQAMSDTSLQGAVNTYGGNGISMYIHEFACPTEDIMEGGNGVYIGDVGARSTTEEENDHGDTVGHMVATAAPHADVYCSIESGSGYYPPSDWLEDGTLQISTVSSARINPSIHGEDGANGAYSSEARDYDNNIYDYGIAYFIAAGNENAGSLSVNASGANSITVGSWEASGKVADYSSSDTSTNGFQKPEVVMQHVVSTLGEVGTSFATPLAAGLAANVLEDHEIFRKHPALLKAHLMSSAHKVNDNSFDDRAGAGYLDWQTASWDFAYLMLAYEPYFVDDGQGRDVWSKSSELEANTPVRVGLTWLADGDWIENNNELNMDIDLEVCSPSNRCWTSEDRSNAWELLEFTTEEAGEYTYTMIMHRREAAAQRNAVKLGLAVNIVTD